MDYERECQKLRAALEHSRGEAAALMVQSVELRASNCDLQSRAALQEGQAAAAGTSHDPAGMADVIAVRAAREVSLRDELSATQLQLEQMRDHLLMVERGRDTAHAEAHPQYCDRKVATLELKLQQMTEQLRCAQTEASMLRADSDALAASRSQVRQLHKSVAEAGSEQMMLQEKTLRLEIECTQVAGPHLVLFC